MTYLEDNPPARQQYIKPRRAPLTGAIVVHTAENTTDLVLPDDGAEGVAGFIRRRSDAGSYHSVVDSDTIVRVIPYDWEAFHDGTGGNRWSLGLSFACRADQWPALPAVWREGALRNAAIEARAMAAHVHAKTGITVPARRITAAQYRDGVAGFISHAELDPGRRTDPGARFPWFVFLDLYAQETTTVPTTPTDNPYPLETREALDLLAEHAGYVGDRKWFGPDALAALHRLKIRAEDLATKNVNLAGHNVTLASERDTAVANREAAEAEAAMLRKQLQEGGRLPTLLAAIDMASTDIGRAWDDLNEAIAKARA